MRKFTNPLDNIRIASPCTANWDEMFGSDRKRFCAECKLNVYNLSDMTRREAENLLVDSEGRLCVRYFRRTDGTVITKDCPVGWTALKRRVSRVGTAAFAIVAGFIGGIGVFKTVEALNWFIQYKNETAPPPASTYEGVSFGGAVANLNNIKGQLDGQPGIKAKPMPEVMVGRVESIEAIKKKAVVAWVE